MLDEATFAAIRAQVQAQYPGWNPDRMTMDRQPGDDLYERLLYEAAGVQPSDAIPNPPSGTFVPPSSEYGVPTSSDGRWVWSSGNWWPNETITTMPITKPTTGAPAMPQLPANLGTMTEAQKIAWYRATLAAGFTNESIRAAVEAVYGRQSDSDWTYLRAKASQAAPAGGAGGAGLLIAAAAAYFLLG